MTSIPWQSSGENGANWCYGHVYGKHDDEYHCITGLAHFAQSRLSFESCRKAKLNTFLQRIRLASTLRYLRVPWRIQHITSGNEEWQWKVLIFSNFQRETSIMVVPSHVWWPERSHGLRMGPMRPGLAEYRDEKDAWRLPLSSVDHDSPMISAIYFEVKLRCILLVISSFSRNWWYYIYIYINQNSLFKKR